MALASIGHAWRLGDLVDGLIPVGLCNGSAAERQITGLSSDSRISVPGALFFACQGEFHHGLEFADEVRRRGAAAIFAEPSQHWSEAAVAKLERELGIPVITVAGLSGLMSAIADRYYRAPSRRMDVCGIAGHAGKVSIAHALAQALAVEAPCGVIGRVGIGFPGDLHIDWAAPQDAVTLQRVLEDLRGRGARSVALEVPASARSEDQVSAIHFTRLVVNNLGCEFTGDRAELEREARTYGQLLAQPGLKWAVLNCDDPLTESLLADLDSSVSVAGYSLSSNARPPERCDLWLTGEAVEALPRGLRMQVQCVRRDEHEKATLQVGLLGACNAADLMAVLAVMCSRGISLDRAARELSGVRAVPGRLECFGGDATPLAVVDSARSPEALEHAIDNLRLHHCRRVITVMGCQAEQDAEERAQLGRLVERLSDQVILTDDNPRGESGAAIIADILSGMRNPEQVRVERQRGLAIRIALALAGIGDGVLVAGKGHETVQDMGDLKVRFSDRAQVVEALREWREGHH